MQSQRLEGVITSAYLEINSVPGLYEDTDAKGNVLCAMNPGEISRFFSYNRKTLLFTTRAINGRLSLRESIACKRAAFAEQKATLITPRLDDYIGFPQEEYLDKECANDEQLKADIEKMLQCSNRSVYA